MARDTVRTAVAVLRDRGPGPRQGHLRRARADAAAVTFDLITWEERAQTDEIHPQL